MNTANKFLVGLHGDRVTILANGPILRGGLTRDEAINLAAWLATMANALPPVGSNPSDPDSWPTDAINEVTELAREIETT